MPKPSRFPSIAEIEKLPEEEQRRVRRALFPRETVFSRRFNAHDIAEWQRAAAREGVDLTTFIEDTMNAAAAKTLEKK